MKIGKSRKTPPKPTEKSKPVSKIAKLVAKLKSAPLPTAAAKKQSAAAKMAKKAEEPASKSTPVAAIRRNVGRTKPTLTRKVSAKTPTPVLPLPAPILKAAEAIEPPKVSPAVTAPIKEDLPKSKIEEPPKARARQPRLVPVDIPAILLEPDHVPNEPAIAGPGARFALTPTFERAASNAPEE